VNVTQASVTTFGVDGRTARAVMGIGGQSYPTLGI